MSRPSAPKMAHDSMSLAPLMPPAVAAVRVLKKPLSSVRLVRALLMISRRNGSWIRRGPAPLVTGACNAYEASVQLRW
jgi:hypothetical protein